MIFDTIPWSNFHELNLNWILEVMKKLDISFDELKKAVNEKDAEQDEQLKELQDWINSFSNEYIEQVIQEYIQTAVFFGLTMDGYFVAYIPETWEDITFSTTGLDIEVPIEPEYGHLVLSY